MVSKDKMLEEIQKQTSFPTAGDPFFTLYFTALSTLYLQNHPLFGSIAKAQKKRKKSKQFLTNAHVVYLFENIINYLMIFKENNPNFPFDKKLHLSTKEGWLNLIEYLWKKYKSEIDELLLTRNVQQNINSRGISVRFLIDRLKLGTKPLKVLDLGCSANLVWSYLLTNSAFPAISDQTSFGTETELINKSANIIFFIKKFIGVDFNYPLKNIHEKHWLLACRHPSEVTEEQIEKTTKLIARYSQLINTSIVEGNLLNPPITDTDFDVVTIFNVLYQLPIKERTIAIENAIHKLNTDNGLFIIQDNCYLTKKSEKIHIVFTDSRKYYTYRTIVGGPIIERLFGESYLELLKFKSTRCQDVIEGKDFKKFMNKI
jgi:hypothetical protein